MCVQGPGVMKGYLNQPELTAEALAGGWLHTGDIAVADDEGFLYLVDRKKDMIITGGFNVFPSEVEKVLADDPAVAMVAVIGVPDEKWGEAVKAVVVARARSDGGCRPARRVREGKEGLAPRAEIRRRRRSLPLTAVGKLDKKSLRARYWGGTSRGVRPRTCRLRIVRRTELDSNPAARFRKISGLESKDILDSGPS